MLRYEHPRHLPSRTDLAGCGTAAATSDVEVTANREREGLCPPQTFPASEWALRPGDAGQKGERRSGRRCQYGHMAHAAAWMAFADGKEAGFAGGAAALHAFAAEIDVIHFLPPGQNRCRPARKAGIGRLARG
jgi:hypothetical protein